MKKWFFLPQSRVRKQHIMQLFDRSGFTMSPNDPLIDLLFWNPNTGNLSINYLPGCFHQSPHELQNTLNTDLSLKNHDLHLVVEFSQRSLRCFFFFNWTGLLSVNRLRGVCQSMDRVGIMLCHLRHGCRDPHPHYHPTTGLCPAELPAHTDQAMQCRTVW